jgi:FAD synthetase
VRTVLVFGTFDVVHPGHRFFLEQARRRGDRLVASIARDSFVARFKRKKPVHNENERLRHVLDTGLVDEAVLSDQETGTYSVIERLKPEVVCLGHDQEALRANLLAWLEARGLQVVVETLEALEPGRYKSSILNARRSRR